MEMMIVFNLRIKITKTTTLHCCLHLQLCLSLDHVKSMHDMVTSLGLVQTEAITLILQKLLQLGCLMSCSLVLLNFPLQRVSLMSGVLTLAPLTTWHHLLHLSLSQMCFYNIVQILYQLEMVLYFLLLTQVILRQPPMLGWFPLFSKFCI